MRTCGDLGPDNTVNEWDFFTYPKTLVGKGGERAAETKMLQRRLVSRLQEVKLGYAARRKTCSAKEKKERLRRKADFVANTRCLRCRALKKPDPAGHRKTMAKAENKLVKSWAKWGYSVGTEDSRIGGR